MNIKEFTDLFTETKRENDIGDNIAIFYKESNMPILINGLVHSKIKIFKSSICTYDLSEEEIKNTEIEMLSFEEYSDSPYSIYIDAEGNVINDIIEDLRSVEINGIIINIKDNKVV